MQKEPVALAVAAKAASAPVGYSVENKEDVKQCEENHSGLSVFSLQCLLTTVSSHYSVFSLQCLLTTVSSLYSVFSLQCLLTTVSSHYSVFSLQCLLTTVSSLYSVFSLQCLLSTVSSHYSVFSLQCLLSTVSSLYSVFSLQCLLSTVSSHYSVFSLQCLLSTVSSHYSVFSLQCLLTTVSSHYSFNDALISGGKVRASTVCRRVKGKGTDTFPHHENDPVGLKLVGQYRVDISMVYVLSLYDLFRNQVLEVISVSSPSHTGHLECSKLVGELHDSTSRNCHRN
ncbi:hypothetical protein STEG23_013311 [Scotinomys teguina]